MFGPLFKGIGLATSPKGRRVIRGAIVLAQTPQGRKMLRQAQLAAARPGEPEAPRDGREDGDGEGRQGDGAPRESRAPEEGGSEPPEARALSRQ